MAETAYNSSTDALRQELKRIRHRRKYGRILRTTIYTLITVAAISVLVAVLWLPVLQIQGNSMTPTLEDGSIVLSVKSKNCQSGDVIAFYYNNKVLVKRVIGTPGDIIDINADGDVFVNGNMLDEPYVDKKHLGQCNMEFPIQVPAAQYFVLGDHRETSIDSRNTALGCVNQEDIVGKILFCIWPFSEFGVIN